MTARVVLAAILAGFLAHVAWFRPQNYFGRYHDDTVYFSSARALAEGQGYIIPSLPGSPPQTKYPIFYPWLLSWVWKLVPRFPANVSYAIALTALFACGALAGAFLLLRRWPGLGGRAALACVALAALHPFFLTLGGAVLSDLPFMAFLLAALAAADLGSPRALALAGVLAGLSMLTRTIGVAVIGGILLWLLWRRAWRAAGAFLLAAAPFLLALIPYGRTRPDVPTLPGWRQTWLYYTDYVAFWKLSVPDWETFQAMVFSNLKDLLLAPSGLCLFPPPGGSASYAGVLFSITLSTGILRGTTRSGLRPVHFVLLCYAPIALLWNYPIMERFLLPFLPLLYAGLWVEGRHLAGMVGANLRSRGAGEKILAGGLALGMAAIAVLAAEHYLKRSSLRLRGEERAALDVEKQEAYQWIRANTTPDTRLLASEDVCLWFATGRQAVWPIAFTTVSFYSNDTARLQFQLDHLTDVARGAGARYWMTVEGDYYIETSSPLVARRLADLKASLPVVFRSSGDRVQVRDLRPWDALYTQRR